MNMNAAELDEIADDVFQGVFEYNDIMEFTPADASVQSEDDWSAVPNELLAVPNELLAVPNELLAIPNELLAVSNQGQNPFGQTAIRSISSPPSVERLTGGADAGSANAEHNLPEVPTARKRRANGIAFHDSFTHERDWELSSDGSGIEVVLVAQVERPDAKTAESKRKRANKRQRSTDAGSQTNARGVGPHVRRTASQDPQPCTHCGATRIGKSEGSDVAGDSSVLFDDMIKDIRREMCREHVRREYMHWQRNNARRGPHMR